MRALSHGKPWTEIVPSTVMSLEDYITSGPQRFQSPNSLNEWIPKDFPDDNFFLDGSFDPPLNLTGKGSEASVCFDWPSLPVFIASYQQAVKSLVRYESTSRISGQTLLSSFHLQLTRSGFSEALEMHLKVVRGLHRKATWNRLTKNRHAETSVSLLKP